MGIANVSFTKETKEKKNYFIIHKNRTSIFCIITWCLFTNSYLCPHEHWGDGLMWLATYFEKVYYPKRHVYRQCFDHRKSHYNWVIHCAVVTCHQPIILYLHAQKGLHWMSKSVAITDNWNMANWLDLT
jgi:hypothetical protein